MVIRRGALGVVGALSLAGSVLGGPGEVLVVNRDGPDVLKFDTDGAAFLGMFSGEGLSLPTDAEWGPDGDLYVTDGGLEAVVRYDGRTGQYKGQFVPKGLGGLHDPQSLVFGPDGNLYVTGTPNCTINEYDGKTGAFIKNVFNLNDTLPGQITFGPSDGLIYYVCQSCRNVKCIDPETGVILKILVYNDGDGPQVARGMAWGPDGNVYLTSGGPNDSIREYDGVTGKFIKTFAHGGMNEPRDVIFGRGGVMYVASGGSHNVMVFDALTGGLIGEGASAGEGGLGKAMGVVELPAPECYADFTGDGTLDLFDFLVYVNGFNAGEPGADCDGNQALDLFDFLCFTNAFNAGC